MEEQERLSLFNIDKIILLLFVGFLLTGEAQSLLNNSGLKWAYLLLLSFGIGYVCTPLVHWVAHRTGVLDMPAVLRWLLLEGVILPFRPRRTARAYSLIWSDRGSPLLVHGLALRAALRAPRLNSSST